METNIQKEVKLKPKMYIYNCIESQLDEIENLADAKEYIKDYMEDGDIHPDIESLLILQEVGFVSVLETGETTEMNNDIVPVCKVSIEPIELDMWLRSDMPKDGTKIIRWNKIWHTEMGVKYNVNHNELALEWITSDCSISYPEESFEPNVWKFNSPPSIITNKQDGKQY